MSAAGAHLVVFANEKGGSGKSTVSVHVAIAAAKSGYRVAALDLDHRQRTFGRYMDNRQATAEAAATDLPMVKTVTFDPSGPRNVIDILDELGSGQDLLIVDSPGREDINTFAAIARAETLVTPINDSFFDFDLIGEVGGQDYQLRRPSFYTRLIWQIRRERAEKSGLGLDWIVLRNRLQHLQAKNMLRVNAALEILSQKAGFRVVPGLMERVGYRELFPVGLTSLDVDVLGEGSRSLINARLEIYTLLNALGLPVSAQKV